MTKIAYCTQIGYIFGIKIVIVGRNTSKFLQVVSYLKIQSKMSAEHFRIADTQISHPTGIYGNIRKTSVPKIRIDITFRNT